MSYCLLKPCTLDPLHLATVARRRVDAQADFVEPNAVSLNGAIAACAKPHDWQRATHLLSIFPGRRFTHRMQCFKPFWLDMAGRKCRANIVSHSSAILACQNEWIQAVRTFTGMWEKRLTPNLICYNSAISACGKASFFRVG